MSDHIAHHAALNLRRPGSALVDRCFHGSSWLNARYSVERPSRTVRPSRAGYTGRSGHAPKSSGAEDWPLETGGSAEPPVERTSTNETYELASAGPPIAASPWA